MIEGAFWIVLTGVLVTASCALLGTFLVLRKMSLLGDALSHAVLPGIAVAFLLSSSRAVLPMFLGAAAFGLITALLVEAFHRRWRVQEDAAIGIVFTALFALGVVIITAYAGQVDLDQECVLYGEIAYTPWDLLLWGDQSLGPRPVWILGAMLAINLTVIALLYKEFKISAFDPALAISVGISATLMHYLLMGLVALTTVASFESVGAILVVAMLIVPGAAAYLWSDRLIAVIGLAVFFGIVSAVAGYFWLATGIVPSPAPWWWSSAGFFSFPCFFRPIRACWRGFISACGCRYKWRKITCCWRWCGARKRRPSALGCGPPSWWRRQPFGVRWRSWRLAVCGGGNCWYRRMAWSNCLQRANKPRCACCAIIGFGRPI